MTDKEHTGIVRRSMERYKERKEQEQRDESCEEEQTTADLAMEKVDILYKMVNEMENKIKKLEDLVEMMLLTHNA